MPGTAGRKDRLNFRLDPHSKMLITRAASSAGQTITEFAISNLVRDARSLLHQQQVTVLNDHDRNRFLSMLAADTEPNEALKKAAKLYKRKRA